MHIDEEIVYFISFSSTSLISYTYIIRTDVCEMQDSQGRSHLLAYKSTHSCRIHHFWDSSRLHLFARIFNSFTIKMYIIVIIIIIIIISFMQGIYIFETNYVPVEYSVAAILLLLFIVLISLVSVLNLLYFYISNFRSMCAVPHMAVFWISLTSCFSGMLLAYFLNNFEIVPVGPITTSITFVFTFHIIIIVIIIITW